MAEPTTFVASCHCQAVQFQFTSDLASPMVCNCSICGRSGAVMVFVPEAHGKVLKGEDQLTDYQFNKHVIHHLFCRTCGMRPFGWGTGKDGAKMYSVNLRCVDGIDIDALALTKWDGKNH